MQNHQTIVEQHGHKRERLRVHHQSNLNVFVCSCILFLLPIYHFAYPNSRPYIGKFHAEIIGLLDFAGSYKNANCCDDYQILFDFYDRVLGQVRRSLFLGALKQYAYDHLFQPCYAAHNRYNVHLEPSICIWQVLGNPHHRQEQLCFGLGLSFSWLQEYQMQFEDQGNIYARKTTSMRRA